jgi:hypothetical protein
MDNQRRSTTANSRFAQAGVLCFYDSEVLNSSFVHLIKFYAPKSASSQSPKTLQPIVK